MPRRNSKPRLPRRPTSPSRNRDSDSSVLDAALDSDQKTIRRFNKKVFKLDSEISFIRIVAAIASLFLAFFFAEEIGNNDIFTFLTLAFIFTSMYMIVKGFFGFWNAEESPRPGELTFPVVLTFAAIGLATFSAIFVVNIAAENIGTGEGIFSDKIDNTLQFKSLVAGENVTLNSTSDEVEISALKRRVDASIKNVSNNEDYTIFHTNGTETEITEIIGVVTGTSGPSVDLSIRSGVDRSAAGTEVIVGGVTIDSTTTGNEFTIFDNGTLPANTWLWFDTSSVGGTVDSVTIVVEYTTTN